MANISLVYQTKVYRIRVKVVKIKKIGHKALKNEDFIDHDYWPMIYEHYKQVTEKNILERYSIKAATIAVSSYIEAPAVIVQRTAVNQVRNVPLYRIPFNSD